jgi:hypothetical protein
MNGVINDIRTRSDDDTFSPRKSVTTNHLHDDQGNNSTPNINKPSTEMDSTEGPLRSMSESTLVDHHKSGDQSTPLPIRQDESLSDGDDFFGTKAAPTNTTAPMDDSVDQKRTEEENQRDNPPSDDDFYNTKTSTIDDDQHRPPSAMKQNSLDETTHFGVTSPTRGQSASSKRSVHVTPDEVSSFKNNKSYSVIYLAIIR